jgi:SPX domain protein involved in polyphosphate accumulation
MKFGSQFDFHKIPEWSEYYLDYEYLKRVLKSLSIRIQESKQ